MKRELFMMSVFPVERFLGGSLYFLLSTSIWLPCWCLSALFVSVSLEELGYFVSRLDSIGVSSLSSFPGHIIRSVYGSFQEKSVKSLMS